MTAPIDPSLKDAEARLWKLIEERTKLGAHTKELDARIWDLFGEDWAIVWTDLAGFSRRVIEFGIIHFLQIIHEQKKLLLPIVEAHDGFLVKAEADSLLLMFKRPESAVDCAIAMQHACQQLSARRVAEEQVLLCVGVGYGRVLRVGESDVYGEEVNAASKLGEDVARANEILVTAALRDRVQERRPALTFEPIDAVSGCAAPFRLGYPRG